MSAREVTLDERRAAMREAEAALGLRANEWITARAGGDRKQIAVADEALQAAAQVYRRTTSALEKTEKRLARRAELTTNEEDR